MNINMMIHTHKEYAFNFDSSWVKASYAGGRGAYEWHPPSPNGEYTNVNSGLNTVSKYRHYYSHIDELDFLKAIGQQATDYYLANNDTDSEYLGVGSYRRYLAIEQGVGYVGEKLHVPSTVESCKILTSESQKEAALRYLQSADVVCSRYRMMHNSIENQYLESQLPEYWNLFKEGIQVVNPSYRKHMMWFTDYSICNYECVYILPRHLFKQLVNEYFDIMEFIWANCSETFPNKSVKQYNCTEINPWRYPGFLNERFVPFFFYANGLRKIEVPLAFLE
jgi:hypothetical protein